MSSTFKTFAVAGVGNLGSFIVKALLQKKQSGLPIRVITLSRSVRIPTLNLFYTTYIDCFHCHYVRLPQMRNSRALFLRVLSSGPSPTNQSHLWSTLSRESTSLSLRLVPAPAVVSVCKDSSLKPQRKPASAFSCPQNTVGLLTPRRIPKPSFMGSCTWFPLVNDLSVP